MKMTWKLADRLMSDFFMLCASANGGIPMDENGEPDIDPENIAIAEEYARDTFERLLAEWELKKGEEWDIEDPSEEG